MESSSPSGNATEPPQHRWAKIMGTAIALLTLTLPPFVIAYYSSNSNVEALPRITYTLPKQGD